MSQESFSAFRASLATDESLREEAARALGPNGTAEGLAAFARERGYDVSTAEINAVVGELSDEELDHVGGGTARSTPVLLQACVKGEHIKSGILTV